MKTLKLAFLVSLVIFAFQAQAKERTYTMVSSGWVAPYTSLAEGGAAKQADWGCTFLEKGESCKLCSFGTNKDAAINTLHSVVSTWERDYDYRYDLSGVKATRLASAREGTSKTGVLRAEACGTLKLVRPATGQVAGN